MLEGPANMPFVEVLGFERDVSRRGTACEKLTANLAEAYGINPDIISIYYLGRSWAGRWC
jgi:hypothetical protein